jgi:hypothetical protein
MAQGKPGTAEEGRSAGCASLLVNGILLVAYSAVLVGVYFEAPGIAIILALCATPAFLWATLNLRTRAGTGRPMTATERFMFLAGSVLSIVVLSVLLSAIAMIAFYAYLVLQCLDKLGPH